MFTQLDGDGNLVIVVTPREAMSVQLACIVTAVYGASMGFPDETFDFVEQLAGDVFKLPRETMIKAARLVESQAHDGHNHTAQEMADMIDSTEADVAQAYDEWEAAGGRITINTEPRLLN